MVTPAMLAKSFALRMGMTEEEWRTRFVASDVRFWIAADVVLSDASTQSW